MRAWRRLGSGSAHVGLSVDGGRGRRQAHAHAVVPVGVLTFGVDLRARLAGWTSAEAGATGWVFAVVRGWHGQLAVGRFAFLCKWSLVRRRTDDRARLN